MASCRLPLVVVLGATGAGKSKLAIEIAKVFKGEIISADSMQIYKGLDIITNKVSEDEQRECPHHLISYLEADYKHYNIVNFRDAALPIIDDLLAKRILSIVVGGTNYYIESVLWNTLVNSKDSSETSPDNAVLLDKHSKMKQKKLPQQTSSALGLHTHKKEVGHTLRTTSLETRECDEQGAHTLLLQTVTKAFTPTAQITDPTVTCVSSHHGFHSDAQLRLACDQTTGVITKFCSGPPSPQTESSSRGTFQHSSSDSCTSGNTAKLQTSVSDGASLTSSAVYSSHVSDQVTTHPDVTIPCNSDTSANNITKHAFIDTDIVLKDPSAIPKCDNSCDNSPSDNSSCDKSLCDNQDPLLEHPVGNVHNSTSLPTATCTTSTATCTSDNKYADIGNLERDQAQTYGDISDKTGLPPQGASVSKGSHSHNPADYSHDDDALLKCLHGMSAMDLYSHLQHIDPRTAARMHPNNRRKICRAIQVFYQTGQTLSSILDEQHGGLEEVKSGPLRYPNPCILWVKCRQPDLNERLDSRVDDMMSRGLIKELESFHNEALRLEALAGSASNENMGHAYTHGVLQMIGFKEFREYLQLSPEERDTETGQNLLHKGIADLKQATRRYAKQQVRWITNRFCNRPGPNVPPIYSVDSTDLTLWDKAVEESIEVVRAFIAGTVPSKAPEVFSPKVDTQMVRNVCDVCGGSVFLYKHEWTVHLRSKKHKFSLKLVREREKLSQLLTAREEVLKQATPETFSQGSDEDSDKYSDKYSDEGSDEESDTAPV